MIMHLIPEGRMEEAVGSHLIVFCGHTLGIIYNTLSGCHYIKTRATKFHSLATDVAGVLVLTDFRDAKTVCPPSALQTYLWDKVPHPAPSFLYRFAVNELESWLMADREGLADFLSVSVNRMPQKPEQEIFPKKALVNIARCSKKTVIKEGIAPPLGHKASVGPSYIALLREFVVDRWNIEAAMIRAPSLARCVRRLRELAAG
jgi:hypothetical protein